jgi:hypothetical protein
LVQMPYLNQRSQTSRLVRAYKIISIEGKNYILTYTNS